MISCHGCTLIAGQERSIGAVVDLQGLQAALHLRTGGLDLSVQHQDPYKFDADSNDNDDNHNDRHVDDN